MAYTFFRYIADSLHLAAFLLLIFKIRKTKNCLGISLKSQILYLLVFITRYIDIFYDWGFMPFHVIFMKCTFIALTVYVIYLLTKALPYSMSYDILGDNYDRMNYLIGGSLIMAVFIHRQWTFEGYLWAYSIWQESVAILPQLHMLTNVNDIENITQGYVGCLGLYRCFYILNWIERYYLTNLFCWTSLLGGIIQTYLYLNFLYYYKTGKKLNKGYIPLKNADTFEQQL